MNPSYQNGTTQGAAPRPRREKVTFKVNEPALITLEMNPPEMPTPGAWGDQYMYFLAGNQIAFLDPPVHAEIMKHWAKAGDSFAICKRKNGRSNAWEVNKQPTHETRREAPPAAPPIAAAATPLPAPPRQGTSPTQLSGHDRISANLMSAAIAQAIEACDQNEFAATHEDIRALAISIYIAATGGRK